MRRLALTSAALLLVGMAATGSAQAYEWGGGHCVGYGCADRAYDDGYRVVRRYEEYDVRPGRRVYKRGIDRHHDWDDEDDVED